MDYSILVLAIIIGAVMLVTGLIGRVRPPRHVNGIFGYRTARSMKNDKLWYAGNRYSGQIRMVQGLVMIVLGSIASFIVKGMQGYIVLLAILIIQSIVTVNLVEKKLKVLDDTPDTKRT